MRRSRTPAYTPLPARVGGRAFLTTLFARAHASRADDAELPAGRTLFVLNVPPHVTPGALVSALEQAGEVLSVRVGDGASAHVVFEEPAGLKKALAAKKPLDLAVTLPSTAAPAPSRAELEASVGAFMQQFEADEAERRAAEEARHNAMDADGFVVVSRKRTGRSTSTDASGATVSVATAGMERHVAGQQDDGDAQGDGGRRKKKKAKDMTDFYHFQQHERKREGLMKLREQFELDKQRIAKMRADRRFKPAGYATEL